MIIKFKNIYSKTTKKITKHNLFRSKALTVPSREEDNTTCPFWLKVTPVIPPWCSLNVTKQKPLLIFHTLTWMTRTMNQLIKMDHIGTKWIILAFVFSINHSSVNLKSNVQTKHVAYWVNQKCSAYLMHNWLSISTTSMRHWHFPLTRPLTLT